MPGWSRLREWGDHDQRHSEAVFVGVGGRNVVVKTSPIVPRDYDGCVGPGGLLAMALTIEATQDGPEPSLLNGWSDSCPVRTQLTPASGPFMVSVNTWLGLRMTFLAQSGPRRRCLIALGAVQIEPGEGA